MTTLLWLTLALLVQEPKASGGLLIREQAAYDVLHYLLEIEVDPERESIQGELTMSARILQPTERIALDLEQRLEVSAVQVNGQQASFEHTDDRIWIRPPRELAVGDPIEVGVHYGGRPRVAPRAPWDGGFTWSKTPGGEPWVTTTCQGEGADLWWPCKDHPSDKPDGFDLVVTVPRGLVCASNGVLVEETRPERDKRRFHWQVRSPISNYNIALNIGPYERLDQKFKSVAGETFPVHFWVLPGSVKKARKALPEFLEHMKFFEELLGPYPFRREKYGIVETPHLGMEHQTIIAYGNRFRHQDFDYDWLHHHELAHEWWGNLVTCRDWKDMWIHEGFGTYMQALYIERKNGPEDYRREMASKRRGIHGGRAIAPREVQDSKQIYFGVGGIKDNDIYFKGSWVLHSLRWLIGDEAFFTALRRMCYPDPELEQVTDGSQVRFVDTEDFRAVAEAAAGVDLAWFFELYLRRPELPELVVRRDGRALELEWEVPEGLEFPMPVPVRMGRKIERVELPGGRVRLENVPSKAEVDPEQRILKAD